MFIILFKVISHAKPTNIKIYTDSVVEAEYALIELTDIDNFRLTMAHPSYDTTTHTIPGIPNTLTPSILTFENIKFSINFPQTDAHVANF